MSITNGPITSGWPDDQSDDAGARRRRTIILGGIAVVLATIVAIATVLVVATHQLGPTADLALVAEKSTGTDPFAPSVTLTNKPLRGDLHLSSSAGTLTGRGIRTVSGTTTGLYGGTENSTCDVAKLANYLSQNPDKGRAWAGVFGISRSEIPYYLDSLTPVVLTADTWVTNHSYSNGQADPFQAVLEAGTAVLVDDSGVPRVRCSCGNPLAPSASAPLSRYNVSGYRWPAYRDNNVVYVTYNTTNSTTVTAAPGVAPQPAALSLVNTDTAAPLLRTVGGLLDLAALPPLAQPLPTSASLNTPFRSEDSALQAANGVATSAAPEAVAALEAPARREASADVQVPTDESTAAQSSSPTPSVAQSSAAAPSSAPSATVPDPSAALAPPVPTSVASSPAPAPTVFAGSGTSIVALTFPGVDGKPVSCTVPAPVVETTAETTTSEAPVPTTTETTETSVETTTEAPVETTTEAPSAIISPSASVTVTLTCDSTVVYTADVSALTSTAVTAATDTAGIWTTMLSANGAATSVPVTSATYGV